MISPGGHIETGVDRLMDMLRDEKRLDITEAANKLKIPLETVRGWADFLEEEGLASIDYTLTKEFLIPRQLTKPEVEKKQKDCTNKCDAFISRVDTALVQLEHEGRAFDKVRNKYKDLKDELGDNFKTVEANIKELNHYEELKTSFEKQARVKRRFYEKDLQKIDKELSMEERRYDKVIADLASEVGKIKREELEVGHLGEEEDRMEVRINAMQELVSNIVEKLTTQAVNIEHHKARIDKLQKLAEMLESKIRDRKHKEIDPMVQITHDQEKKIMRIQDDIVNKVKENVAHMGAYEEKSEKIAKKFYALFEKRAKTDVLMKSMAENEENMEKELKDLLLQAKAYDLATSKKGTNEFIKALEEKFNQFKGEKKQFHEKFGSLQGLISDEDKSVEAVVHKE